MKSINNSQGDHDQLAFKHIESTLHEAKPMASTRASRFLAQQEKNPRAADHCNKDNEICGMEGKNASCCNNKCMELAYDKDNCGACKRKCVYTEVCCRGECVNLSYDKRHCGSCNNKCMPGGYCIYGMCDYA
ncbi:Stigma-specific STIG1-like protein 3 [Forsythia ovata]|uniref:Stigma-specific STIG1-like protein 3 n=1 Tax=Forsythia ovata TaxID=205694 RepID=A0ABD1SN10_9LAMI